MPVITSTYKPPLLFKNTHLNTVYKTLFYKNDIHYTRTRITTDDDDFLDLDFSLVGSKTLVVAMHGLEGSATSKYMISACNFLNTQNIDCVAVNFRGCSGEDNQQLYSYNSGKTDDVGRIIDYLLNNYDYENIVLLGYSMGGNITLKYLGEHEFIPSFIKGAVTISVPCDLEGSSNALIRWENSLYIQRFLRTLKKKSVEKIAKFPQNQLNKEAILSAKTFTDFDNAVTAPLGGFKNAKDYWTQSSSKQFLPNIQKPTLIVSALDDTFLSESCFPFMEASANEHLFLETPKYGGHVGFNTAIVGKDDLWSEKRIYKFIQHIIS